MLPFCLLAQSIDPKLKPESSCPCHKLCALLSKDPVARSLPFAEHAWNAQGRISGQLLEVDVLYLQTYRSRKETRSSQEHTNTSMQHHRGYWRMMRPEIPGMRFHGRQSSWGPDWLQLFKGNGVLVTFSKSEIIHVSDVNNPFASISECAATCFKFGGHLLGPHTSFCSHAGGQPLMTSRSRPKPA